MTDRLITARTSLVVLLLTLAFAIGCTPLHTRKFYTHEIAVECRPTYCFYPRIVAYENVARVPGPSIDQAYWVSLKVYDPDVIVRDLPVNTEGNLVRDTVADQFLDRVLGELLVDSLRLKLLPGKEELLLFPDAINYAPRSVNYLSIQFGATELPAEATELLAIFYYRQAETPGKSDSLLFVMKRFDEHSEGIVGDAVGLDLWEDRDEL